MSTKAQTTSTDSFFKSNVLGHPSGLFVLFFTEMWERFSFYGMRVLLINFLTMAAISYNPGWEWSAENAGALFGTYAMLLYLTPILGGVLADKWLGYRGAVILGAIIMTLGHVSMAFETEFSLYFGLVLLVLGTGFFKPNVTSIISKMYKNHPEKKDGAFTIFYMGVNAGAFFGMLLCGYLAERVGWAWGFGLAGVFMLLGTLQFWLATPLFGNIGAKPNHNLDSLENLPEADDEMNHVSEKKENTTTNKSNPFTKVDYILITLSSVIGLLYAINDPLSKIGGFDMFSWANIPGFISGQYLIVLIGLVAFLYLAFSRIFRYDMITRDRMIAVIIFAFFTVFFWMSFEQGASSLVIFARDNVDRVLEGNSALYFNIINALLSVIPLIIITWVLIKLAKATKTKILGSNIVLTVCFAAVWVVVVWMLNRDFNTVAYDVTFDTYKINELDEKGNHKYIVDDRSGDTTYLYSYQPVVKNIAQPANAEVISYTTQIGMPFLNVKKGDDVTIIRKNNENTEFAFLFDERLKEAKENGIKLQKPDQIINGKISAVKENWVEIPASWFSILNSFFIIALASLISKWWESKYNPSAAVKYGLGLIIMAIGFGVLAFGTSGMVEGVKVSMVWLIFAYLFHTIGELCISPVGLSYVSKLVPARMIALMFGMWYLAIAIGNKLAAVLGGQIENITKEYSLSTFFLIFTIVPAVAGILVIVLNPVLKKLMHGVE